MKYVFHVTSKGEKLLISYGKSSSLSLLSSLRFFYYDNVLLILTTHNLQQNQVHHTHMHNFVTM